MTDLDLSKYDGHTPGPWAFVEWTDETPFPSGVMVAVQREGTHNGAGRICEMVAQGDGRYDPEVTTANARLIADAPLLLAEVKRLREELQRAREDHHRLGAWPSCPQCVKFYRDDEEAAVQNDRLRQSHVRLLAAVKNDCLTRVTKEGLCWCHMQISPHGGYCVELRAAVAKAEALNAE